MKMCSCCPGVGKVWFRASIGASVPKVPVKKRAFTLRTRPDKGKKDTHPKVCSIVVGTNGARLQKSSLSQKCYIRVAVVSLPILEVSSGIQ